jgi:hypothetical protein
LRRLSALFALPVLVALGVARPASAFDPFEIQVYGPGIDEPGQASLELHVNAAWGGSSVPEYPGQVPQGRAGHYTLEPAIGVLEWLELGAYIQAFSAPDGGFQGGGWKIRAKGIVPRRITGDFFAGLNMEVGWFPPTVQPDAWAAEFRPILGFSDRWLYAALNLTFGFPLSGADAFRVELEPSVKLEVNTQLGFGVGVEYYASMGFANALPAPSQWGQILFGVVDLLPPAGGAESPWELDVGLGHGLTAATPQQWVAKVIVGRSF